MEMTLSMLCRRPWRVRKGSCVMTWRYSLNVGAGTKALEMPVSSSRLMKRWPLAVPGRWRQMTRPATLSCWLFGAFVRDLADQMFWARS